MPGTKQLNPFAHAFLPPGGPAAAPPTERLAGLRLGGARPDAGGLAVPARGAPVVDGGFALWSGCASHRLTGAVRESQQDEVAEEGDLELEPHFQEEEHEGQPGPHSPCSSAEASPHTSVRGWGRGGKGEVCGC